MPRRTRRDQRRLAAIVSVDVVGYSRLMGSDERGTMTRWKAVRRELLDPKIAEYGGRIVNTAGDNSLLEFPSVVDAVRCAVDVQRAMAERNASAATGQRFDFRIGINVGDIIIDGDQIFGDGVNVAARVQALAPPGGICTSKVVRDEVLDKLSFTFEDLGAQKVKNIARPVEVYRVEFGAALPTPAASASKSLRLAVAVLPFTAPGADPDTERFAGELTRDLTSALAGDMRMTQVLSRDLVARYKGKRIDARSVGRELDASYLIESEVQRVNKRFQIDVRLVEALGATQVWSERLEIAQARRNKDLAVLLSRLCSHIEGGLKEANYRRFAGPPAPDAGPLDLTWHAYAAWQRGNNTMQGVLEARKWFDQALRLDPNFLPAVRGRWSTLGAELDLDPKAELGRILREMDELSFRAVSIDGSDPSSWVNRATTLVRQQRWEAALEANAKAEKHASGADGWVLNQRAGIMLLIGQPEEAQALVDRELALDPQNQEELGWAWLQRGRAFMALGRHDEAIAACERDIALDNWWLPHLYLVAGYALKGETSKAAAEKAAVLELRPGTSIADFKKLYWSDNPAFVQQTEAHLLAGLRKAGFPEDYGEAVATPTASAPASLRLAVAVLPFTASNSDHEEESLADELTRDLTSALGTMRMMQVVSRDLAASHRGKSVDPRRVGRELDASYLVEGVVRYLEERIEVNVELIEAASATQLWSERFGIGQARSAKDVAGLLLRLSNRIVGGIKTATMRRFASEPAPNASPLELTWHGYSAWYGDNNTVRGVLEARKWFDKALQLDPRFLPAIRGRLHTLEVELSLDPRAANVRIPREMDELSFRAVSIDSSDAISWYDRAATLVREQRWEAALQANAQAEKLSPVTVGWVLNQRAGIMLLTGRPEEALALVERQLALDPQEQDELGSAMLQRCRACIALGRHDEAIAAGEKVVALDNSWLPHVYLLAGYALVGEVAKAAAEKATLLELRPSASIADFRRLYCSDNPAFVQQTEAHLLAGLRKAGLPEE